MAQKTPTLVNAKCLEVDCPHFGWIKVRFADLDFDYWEDCRDRGLNIYVDCVCGEKHEIAVWA